MSDQRPAAPSPTAPRRLHPVSPVVRAGQLLPALAFALLAVGMDQLGGDPLGMLALLALLVVGTAIGVVGFWLSWRRYSFWFDADGDLRIRSGIWQVNERRVQVSRLQSVDVTQPLVARLFGLAEVRPEVAGASSGATKLSYLSYDEALRLRADLLARAAGIRLGAEEPAPVAPETVLVSVPAGVLLASLVLQPSTLLLGVTLPVAAVGMLLTGTYEGLFAVALLFGTPFFVVGGQFLTYFGFTVAESPDGLRLRFGLTSHRSQTVPPGRVQAVRLQRPILWRRRGWVRMQVNVAGASAGEDAENRPSMLLPVAPEPLARAVLGQVLPGVDPLAVTLTPAPRRARWVAPLQRRRLAAGADDRAFVARHGWLVPTWDVVPHARTQSVRLTQGPWQRRLGLASMHVDSTPGPVKITAAHQNAATLRRVAEDQVALARTARASGPRDRWLTR